MSPDAKLGNDVVVNPFCVLGNCIIGDHCIIHPHVYIGDNVTIESGVEIFNGAVIGKIPKGAGCTARPIEYNKSITVGKCSCICPHAIIYYDVEIGHHTLIGDGASIREQCRIGNSCLISRYVTLNYNVVVGDNVKIMDLSHISGNSIIKDNVFISALAGTANDNRIIEGYGDHVSGQLIKEGAIIGLGAKLLPGIQIGCKARVGASALVTHDVADKQLVKGIPARVE